MGGRQGQGKWGVDSMTALKQAPRPPLKKTSSVPEMRWSRGYAGIAVYPKCWESPGFPWRGIEKKKKNIIIFIF